MSDCTCPGPGFCPARGRTVTATGHRICRRGDPRGIEAYFGNGGGVAAVAAPAPAPVPAGQRAGECAYLGGPVIGADGRQATKLCPTCRGTVKLKLLGCRHPGHAGDPTTSEKDCKTCRDYEPKGVGMGPMGTMPVPMVVPSMKRPGVWKGGITQIMVTRSCDLSCHGCSAGSNLISKPAVMTPDQFEQAVLSLDGYWGIRGLFGGNPCTSRYFEDYCRILRAHVPWELRGIWTNNMLGKGALCRITFNPAVSNINTHMQEDAYREFEAEWPEALSARREHTTTGLKEDSRHGSPWVSMSDLETLPFPDGTDRENTEENRWRLIGGCEINKAWSAIVLLVGGKLRAFACEVAGHMAALHADNPNWAGTGQAMSDLGLACEPGWWRRPLADFEPQFRGLCHHCSVPLKRPGQLAIGGEREEFSETHRHIARPKVRDRPVEFISVETLAKRDRPAVEYLTGSAPKAALQ